MIINTITPPKPTQSEEKPHAQALHLPKQPLLLFLEPRQEPSSLFFGGLRPSSVRIPSAQRPMRRNIGISILALDMRQVIPIGHQIHLVDADELGALEELPADEHDEHDGEFDVVRDEIHGVEAGAEAGPALHEDQDGVENHRQDGADGVGPVLVGEEVLEVLVADAGAEAQGGDADEEPGELVGDADDTLAEVLEFGGKRWDKGGRKGLLLKPRPQLAGADVAGAEAESADHRGRQHGDPRDLEPVQVPEDPRRVTVDRQCVEEARAREERVVGGGDHARHDHRVDEAACHGAAGFDEDDRERAGGRRLGGEARVVVGDVQADQHDRDDVEEDDAPEDVAHDPRERLGGVLGLAGGDGDGFGAAAAGVVSLAWAGIALWLGIV